MIPAAAKTTVRDLSPSNANQRTLAIIGETSQRWAVTGDADDRPRPRENSERKRTHRRLIGDTLTRWPCKRRRAPSFSAVSSGMAVEVIPVAR